MGGKKLPQSEVERRIRVVEALIVQGRALDLGALTLGLEEAGIVVHPATAIRYANEARKRLNSADDELRAARREILTRKVLALDAALAAGITKHDVVPSWADRIACLKLLRDIVGIEPGPEARVALTPAEAGLIDLEKKNEQELDSLLVEMLQKSASMLESVKPESGKESVQ